jgi:hypothetical protein
MVERTLDDPAQPPETPVKFGAPLPPRLLAALGGATLAFVALTDWLFFGHPTGWTLGLYGLVLLEALLWRDRRFPAGRPRAVIAAALVLLFLGCIEEPNRLVVTLAGLGLITLALSFREGWRDSAVDWAQRWIVYGFLSWFFLPASVAGSAAAARRRPVVRGGGSFLSKWSLAGVLCALFLWLFSAANPIIEGWLASFRQTLADAFDTLPTVPRMLFWLATACQVWALLGFRSGLDKQNLDFLEQGPRTNPGGFLAPAAVLRALAAFNLLFAVQTVLDLFYLWGGAALPDGLTYAQYAHRGAYPLIATALLAATFVLLAFRPGAPDTHRRRACLLVYAWLAQNVFLVVSSAWRLRLYVEVYTLSRMRVAAAVWMLLVACGLVWILVRIATGRSNRWLVNVNALTAAGVLFVCAFPNLDGAIARFNVQRCEEIRGKGEGFPAIDVAYLESLGYDTLPALLWLADRCGDHPRAAPRLRHAILRLEGQLQDDLSDWRGWTFRRARLRRLLRERAAAPAAADGAFI